LNEEIEMDVEKAVEQVQQDGHEVVIDLINRFSKTEDRREGIATMMIISSRLLSYCIYAMDMHKDAEMEMLRGWFQDTLEHVESVRRKEKEHKIIIQ
jgi:hypothetical protein